MTALLLAGCGVGVYSHSSGMEDKSEISFVAERKSDVEVTVDDRTYSVQTVKQKDWKKSRKIKKTVLNTIVLPVGQHSVTVSMDGKVVFTKKIFVSNGEHKVIEL